MASLLSEGTYLGPGRTGANFVCLIFFWRGEKLEKFLQVPNFTGGRIRPTSF